MKGTNVRESWFRAILFGEVAVLLGLAVGCGSGPAGGGWQGTVRDSAGVFLVENPAVGVWGRGEVPVVREVLRIGRVEGEAEYQFGEIGGVNVDNAGVIYVGERQAREIRVYDREGRFLRRIGRPGSGPGELGAGGTSVFFGPGDTLIVPDPGQRRVNIFLRDGSFVRSYPLSATEGVSRRWAPAPDSGLLQQLRQLSLPGREDTGPDIVVRRGWAGVILDTVLVLPPVVGLRFGGGGAPTMTLFEPEPVWGVAGDGRLFFAVNSEYRIEVRSLTGELLRVIRKEFEPRRVDAADRRLLFDHISERFERQGIPPAALVALLQGIEIADHYPAFAGLMEGPAGTLWVQQIQTARRVAAGSGTFTPAELGAPEWDAFDREGRFLGVVTLPPRFQPQVVHGNRIYGVARDELDVPYVMVVEMVANWSPK